MLLQETLDDPAHRFVIGQAEAHQLKQENTKSLQFLRKVPIRKFLFLSALLIADR